MADNTINNVLSVPSQDQALGLSSMPTTPTTPTSPLPKAKKANPLNDLIDTEKSYVDNLTGIIRKVAASWSRSNLPPLEMDTMFRSIEGVYKANRSLHSKLKEIGANPSSPKALGDLLMRWIDDLEAPYTAYCTKYSCGFDTWDPVQSNPKLGPILAAFSETNPPPGNAEVWTLDALFLLPKGRLKYYRKLYSRLLKSTAPGRSDHKLLVSALDTLDRLLDTLDTRASISVGDGPAAAAADARPVEMEDEVVIDMRTRSLSPSAAPLLANGRGSTNGSDSGSARGSSVGERLSRETAATSISRGSNSTLSMPITTLERRLSTQRTLDIFTMTPKVVKLQMSPPNLTFTRELRTSAEVVIRFMPKATNEEVVHYQGHIYLLSDLFLMCERMTTEEQALPGNEGADMWLCYPPLAGKVLRVSEVPGKDNAIQVAIMKKEFIILETDTAERRDRLLSQLKECIEFSGSLPPPSKVPPPPLPPLLFQNSSRGSQDMAGQDINGGPPPPDYQPNPSDTRMPPPGQFRPPGGPNLGGPPGRNNSFGMGPPGSSPFGPGPQMGMNGQPMGPPPLNQGGPPPQMGPPHMLGGPPPHMGNPPHMQGGLPPHLGGPPPHMGGPGGPPQMGGPPHTQGGPPPHIGGLPSGPAMMRQPFNGPPGPGRLNGPPLNGPPGPFPGQFGPGLPNRPSFNSPGPGGMMPPSGQGVPPRPPSEPTMGIRKSQSSHSLTLQYSNEPGVPAPPLPPFASPYGNSMIRNHSQPSLHAPQPRPMLPSVASRATSMVEPSFDDPSPPGSPVPEMPQHTGPVTSVIAAQMKCKVFLQQHHAQWKSLGSARLKLYREDPTNVKQLVVEADNKDKTILISTIVLTDGVERVGKTGVAIELSNQGVRAGIVYMLQLRNETSAGGLFDSLLAGSDRSRGI